MASQLASVVAVIFMVIILGEFIWAVYARHKGVLPLFTRNAPELLVSLGVIGAFCAVVVGLLSFDVNAAQQSAGGLLAGLKAGLLISMLGMGLAIIYRGLSTFRVLSGTDSGHAEECQLGIADLYQVMAEQRDGMQRLLAVSAEQQQATMALHESIAGEQRNSLMSQLTSQHGDSRAQQQALLSVLAQRQQSFEVFEQQLWSRLTAFGDNLSTAASQHVINAIQEVIVDFNLSMTDQFGDNFKRFAQAVEQLAQWQDAYKDQLGQMREQFDRSVTAMAKAEMSLKAISSHAKHIPDVMQQLQQVLEVNQHQIAELSRHLDVFVAVRDSAVAAMPALNVRIDAVVDGFEQASGSLISAVSVSTDKVQEALLDGTTGFIDGSKRVNDMLLASSSTLSDQSDQMRRTLVALVGEINGALRTLPGELVEGSRKMSEDLRTTGNLLLQEGERSRQAFDGGLHNMREQLAMALAEMSTQQTAEAKKIFAGLQRQIDGVLGDTGESVARQVQMIDDTLAKEITVTLTEMGRALTSITGQFTHDYQELVGAMKNVVKAA